MVVRVSRIVRDVVASHHLLLEVEQLALLVYSRIYRQSLGRALGKSSFCRLRLLRTGSDLDLLEGYASSRQREGVTIFWGYDAAMIRELPRLELHLSMLLCVSLVGACDLELRLMTVLLVRVGLRVVFVDLIEHVLRGFSVHFAVLEHDLRRRYSPSFALEVLLVRSQKGVLGLDGAAHHTDLLYRQQGTH